MKVKRFIISEKDDVVDTNTQSAEVVTLDPWNENKDNLWNNNDGQAASDWNVNSNDQGINNQGEDIRPSHLAIMPIRIMVKNHGFCSAILPATLPFLKRIPV